MLRLKNIVSKGLCKVVTFGLALGMTLCITNVVRGESRYLAITSNTKLYNGSTMETDSGYIPAGDQHLRVHVASVTAGGNLKATRWTYGWLWWSEQESSNIYVTKSNQYVNFKEWYISDKENTKYKIQCSGSSGTVINVNGGYVVVN